MSTTVNTTKSPARHRARSTTWTTPRPTPSLQQGAGDYGRPLGFGYYLVPDMASEPVSRAEEADRFGLDLIGLRDRPYQRRYGDVLALMAAVLQATGRARVFPAVACLPLRPPATLAKQLATMDLLGRGRVELGLGAGEYWGAIAAYGGRRLDRAQARAALEEGVHVLRAMWSGERGVRFDGEHHRLSDAQPGPLPLHEISVWLGVSGPRSLRMAGRIADGWLGSTASTPPSHLAAVNRVLDDAATAAGRDPAELRRMYILKGHIDERGTRGFLRGPVRQWVEEMTGLALEQGIDSFLYAGHPDNLPTFAMEIVPAVREQVARVRARNRRRVSPGTGTDRRTPA